MNASVLLLLVYVGLVHSRQYLAWEPGRNYVYDVRSKLQGPECATENGGLVVDYKIIATPVAPNTIHLNPHDFKVVGVEDENESKYPILTQIRSYVESPMTMSFQNGMVESITVEANLPEWAMDIKKEQASHFSANSNAFKRPSQPILNSNYYKYNSFEAGMHGRCGNKYRISRMNNYNQELSFYGGGDNQNEPVINNFNNLCNPGDKFYIIVKSTKLYNCSGEENYIQNRKPTATTRFIVCGRRSQNQFKFLKIQQEYKTSSSEQEVTSSISLIGLNRASPVKPIAEPKVLNNMAKSYSVKYPQNNPAPYNLSVAHPGTNSEKVVLVHMANTPGAMRWALAQGANAVEVDLQFSGNNPSVFQHSVGLQTCDCTCVCPFGGLLCPKNSICKALWSETGSHCTASSTVEDMTMAFGNEDVRSKLALIYIDCKLSNSMVDFFGAGYNLVKILDQNTFDRGYKGQVLISGLQVKYSDFLKGALRAANQSKYTDKYFYTYDGEYKNYEKVWDGLLQLRTNKIAYQTGISVCVPSTYYEAITGSLKKEAYAGVGIWTLDKPESMQKYLSLGVDSIMTHKPTLAKNLIDNELATPGNALVPKLVPEPPPVYWECDCNYHMGGCTISKAAPPNWACKCIYKFLQFSCRGKTVPCSDGNAVICKKPDESQPACLFGEGDCGGY